MCATTQVLATVGADGFNGDTMFGINSSFYAASVARGGRAIATQPECGTNHRHLLAHNGSAQFPFADGETLPWNTMSWNYWGYLPPGRYACQNCAWYPAVPVLVFGVVRVSCGIWWTAPLRLPCAGAVHRQRRCHRHHQPDGVDHCRAWPAPRVALPRAGAAAHGADLRAVGRDAHRWPAARVCQRCVVGVCVHLCPAVYNEPRAEAEVLLLLHKTPFCDAHAAESYSPRCSCRESDRVVVRSWVQTWCPPCVLW